MRKTLEAALFIAGRRLSLRELCSISNLDTNSVKSELSALKNEYLARNSPIEITEEADGFKMELRIDFLNKVKTLAPQMDMGRALLTTLSYIAYKQPIRQSLLVKKFGNRIYDYVKELEKRGFIHSERSKRSKLLTTTKKLLSYLGENDIQKLRNSFDAAKLEQQLQKELAQKEIEDAFAPKQKTRKRKKQKDELLEKKELSVDEWSQVLEKEEAQKIAKQQSLLPGLPEVQTENAQEQKQEKKNAATTQN